MCHIIQQVYHIYRVKDDLESQSNIFKVLFLPNLKHANTEFLVSRLDITINVCHYIKQLSVNLNI